MGGEKEKTKKKKKKKGNVGTTRARVTCSSLCDLNGRPDGKRSGNKTGERERERERESPLVESLVGTISGIVARAKQSFNYALASPSRLFFSSALDSRLLDSLLPRVFSVASANRGVVPSPSPLRLSVPFLPPRPSSPRLAKQRNDREEKAEGGGGGGGE